GWWGSEPARDDLRTVPGFSDVLAAQAQPAEFVAFAPQVIVGSRQHHPGPTAAELVDLPCRSSTEFVAVLAGDVVGQQRREGLWALVDRDLDQPKGGVEIAPDQHLFAPDDHG